MEIIVWIVIGGLAGWIASMIMGTNEGQGCIVDIIVGIVGAFLGGLVLDLLGVGSPGLDFSVWSLVTAILGAIILLAIVKAIRR